MALDGPNPKAHLIYGPAGVPAPAGLFFVLESEPGFLGEAVINLMANDTGNSGPGPAQVDLPGSFPGWLSLPPETIPPRGATSQVELCRMGGSATKPAGPWSCVWRKWRCPAGEAM